ncbi:MAG: hypothetical protein KGI91_12005 [Burkholderiales bacterium]|nr:hypothetical protein [Burkholderiales bacterium]MDE2077778.1 hypothetical protein [Burkholderiales bacterium]MDE2432276.1 hypothetical protein [Burkholderiales bacterium]
MQKIKGAVAAVALSAIGLSAHAFTAVDDAELSNVTGQDGVTIGGDLNIKIGSFTWTDTDSTGGSVSFNNIGIKGMFVQTIDVLDATTAVTATINAMKQYVGSQAFSEAYKLITGGVYDGVSDVVQFAFPNAGLDTRLTPTITIGSITNGNSTKSYGSLAIKNLDMQGTKIWLWAH